MSTYHDIEELLNKVVPFAKHVGIVIVEVGNGRGAAELSLTSSTANHIGTIHAGALFTVAEAASGAAMAGIFGDQPNNILPVAAGAKISFKKPAKGKVTATAKAAGDPFEIADQLTRDGRIQFDVGVTITDQSGVRVAEMDVAWNVRRLG